MATIHISEAEATRDFAALLAQVRAGAEIIIEAGPAPVAILRPANTPPGRLLSEAISIAKQYEQELGSPLTMDDAFAADMQDIILHREPRQTAWD